MIRTIANLFSFLFLFGNPSLKSAHAKENSHLPFNFKSRSSEFVIDQNLQVQAYRLRGQTKVTLQREQIPFYEVRSADLLNPKLIGTTIRKARHPKFGNGTELAARLQFQGTKEGTRIDLECTFGHYANFPDTLLSDCTLKNRGQRNVAIQSIEEAQIAINSKPDGSQSDMTLFQGIFPGEYQADFTTIPLTENYQSENFLGVLAPNRDPKGGGIPLLDLWNASMGISISHISPKPEFLHMPVTPYGKGAHRVSISETFSAQGDVIVLKPGDSFKTVPAALTTHTLDYFDALRVYAKLMTHQGVKMLKEPAPNIPVAYWKTWGYEKNFGVSDILAKLPELRELGIQMIMLDDGWFSNYGDWLPSREAKKFPAGESEMITLIRRLHKEGFYVGLWWSPLIAQPDSEVIRKHSDWAMRDKNLARYKMQDPDAFYLCPAHPEVKKFWAAQIKKFYKDWGIDYIYHDWAELISVPPCHNPAHRHVSPLQPVWEFPEQFARIYRQIQGLRPGSGVEMCECGRPHDPYKMPYYNVSTASDPKSIDDILKKMKVEKALNGSRSPFSVGYVLPKQLYDYDPGTISLMLGVGSLFQTYYRELPPETKLEWKKHLRLFRELKLYEGEYLNLYDVAYDKPQMHALKKGEKIYYYSPGKFSGEIELRGLREDRSYSLVDYRSGKSLGKIMRGERRIKVDFDNDLLAVAEPEAPRP